MQDRDFDQLFKERFEDTEIQPSASVWAGIQKEIAPKRKYRLPVYWMAAATVLVALTAGLLFNKTERIKLHGKSQVLASVIKPAQSEEVSAQQQPESASGTEEHYKQEEAVIQYAAKPPKEDVQQKSLIAMQPISDDSHLNTVEPEIKSLEPMAEATETLPAVEAAVALNEKPEGNVIAEEALPLKDPGLEAEQPARRIRNAGDLVNFVVDKLDKRDQKILEFQTDADDNSSLVAINIGPFKFNSRKHK